MFQMHIKFWVEEDVQWVITDLKLMIALSSFGTGKARCYSVDLKSHRVCKASCRTVFNTQQGPTH